VTVLPRPAATPSSGIATPVEHHRRLWTALAVVEVALASTAVLLDLLVPALVVCVLAGLSLVVRRRGPASLGFHRPAHAGRLAGRVLLLASGWTVLQFCLVMPVLNHLTGDRQDLSAFEDLEGNLGLFAALVVASWLLGALVEETAVRGYLQTRITDVLGVQRLGIVVAVVLTAALFGALHTEQGAIGVTLTFLDGLFFGWLRWHHGTLWASVLGHGFNNTIGIATFFLVGPVYGLW
jgi:membrane protease YdiL (CAAX protease family)